LNALVCAIFPTFIYFLFGASRQLSIGPEAIVSVITGAAIQAEMASHPDTGVSAPQIAATMAFVTGVLTTGLALMKGGFIDNILSGFLLCGFITGVAFLIISEQMPEMFGLTVKLPGEDSTLVKMITAFKAFNTFSVSATLITLSNVGFLLGLRRVKKLYGHCSIWLKRAPEILLLVMIMILLSFSLDLKSKGIRTLGMFDNQFKAPKVPWLDPDLMSRLIQPSVTALLVGYVECQTTTRNFGLKNGYFPDADQEMFTFGLMNLFISFFGGFPVFGSLTRSRLLAGAGAKTTIANLISAIIVLLATLIMVPALQFLPKSTLASIVFAAALGLIEIHEIIFVFQCRSWTEIFMFLLTTIITFATSISVGILICLGLSALLICKRSTTSSLSVIGRLQSSFSNHEYEYVDVQENPDAELMEGLMIVRFNESMLFYNCGMTRRAMEALMMAESKILVQRIHDQQKRFGGDSIGRGGGGGSGRRRDSEASLVGGLGGGEGGGGSRSSDPNGYRDYTGQNIGLYSAEDDFTRVPVNRAVARQRSVKHGLPLPADLDPRQDSSSNSNSNNNSNSRFGLINNNNNTHSYFGNSGGVFNGNRISIMNSRPTKSKVPYGGEKLLLKDPESGGFLLPTPLHNSDPSDDSEENTGLHTIIIDFSNCLELDSAACYILKKIVHQFQKQGLLVHMVGVSEEQKALFEKSGLGKLLKGCIFDDLRQSIGVVESTLDVVNWTRDY
jgi:high affinity sulfate transporter 1